MFALPVYRLKLVRDGTLCLPRVRVAGPMRAARIISEFIGDADRETLVALFLEGEQIPTGIQVISVGTLDSLETTAREVFKGAMLANAEGIILGHNHPSRGLEPSDEDVSMTKGLIEAGIIVGIKVWDHVIVGPSGRFVSLRKRGLLKPDAIADLIENTKPRTDP